MSLIPRLSLSRSHSKTLPHRDPEESAEREALRFPPAPRPHVPQLLRSLQLTSRRHEARHPAQTKTGSVSASRARTARDLPARPSARTHRPGGPGPLPSPPRAARPARSPAAGPYTYSAVGRRPVPATAARRATGEGRPVPDGPAAPAHSCGSLRSAAAASLGAGPASAPAPASAASLASVQLNDVVQRHVHFVGHGGRGIGLGSSPRVSTPFRHFRRRVPGATADWLRKRRGAGRRVRGGSRGSTGAAARCPTAVAVVFIPSRAGAGAAN